MNNNLTVLKHFMDNKDKKFTIKRTAELLHMNYRIAHQEISSLEKDKLIMVERVGNSRVCQFIYTYCSKMVAVEELRKQDVFKNKDVQLIYKRISEIKNPLYILVLFGSFAKQTNKKGSDIDICLITDNEDIIKEVQKILHITPLPVHLLDFSPEQFLSLLKTKEANVGNEIVKNNIIFHGVEGFYELVNNVNTG